MQAPGRKGDHLPRIPELDRRRLGSVRARLEALPGWSAWVRGDWSYHGKSHTELRRPRRPNRMQRGLRRSRTSVSARRKDESGLDVALYVNNVFDMQGDVFLIGATATPTMKYTNRPRTIGVELSKRF